MPSFKVTLSIILIFHGIYALYASFTGKKTIFFELPNTTYLSKKIFGKNFNRWHNLFWGTIEIIIGFISVKYFLFN